MTTSVNGRSSGAGPPASVQVKPLGSMSAADDPQAACVCGHLFAQHDGIATRYCDATVAGGMARGCVCQVTAGT